MKKGDKVRIYQKPITEEDFEGEATLIRKDLTDKKNNLEVWWVKFKGDTREFRRTIKG